MKVIKPQKLGVLTRTFEHGGRCHFTVSVLVFFPFDAPHALLSEIDLWKFLPKELGQEGAVDDAMPKPHGEVLVTGRAFPVRSPQPACTVRVQIGAIDKTLRVVGDRVWGKDDIPTSPEPFTDLPLTYDRSFGGEGYPMNPTGRGAVSLPGPRGPVRPLPNIEDPRHLVRSPKDRPVLPAGLGPYEFTWPQRFAKAGTYDTAWLKTRFPGLADDVDLTMFNTAPADQWLQGYFVGDERFVLEHLHPSRPVLEGRLPGVSTRVFVNRRTPSGERFSEVSTRLDTVRFFPHAERGVLVYRGVTQVAEDDADDVLQLVVACEDLGAPRAVSHYEDVFRARMDRQKGVLLALRDSDLMPPARDGDIPPPAEPDPLVAAVATEGLLRQNLRRRAEREHEKLVERVQDAGLDPAVHVAPLPPEPPPPDLENLTATVEQAQAQAAEARSEAENRKAQAEAQMREVCEQHGMDYEKLVAQAREGSGGPPKFSAETELAKLHALAEQSRAAGGTSPELEALAADPTLAQRLREGEQKLRESYRRFAQYFPAAARLTGDASTRLREEVLRAIAAGESLAGRDLTGVDLTDCNLSGADFHDALMESAVLAYCDLRNANLSGAVLARADISYARLHGTNLEGANLGGARLCHSWLGGSTRLAGATLAKADISHAVLTGADLTGADFLEAVFIGANLADVVAPKVLFYKPDFTGVIFARADLGGATVIEAKLTGTDFTNAKLEGAVFVTAVGERPVFHEAWLKNLRVVQDSSLEHADFRGAVLTSANLRGTLLSGSDFTAASLRGVDFSNCKLSAARFVGADAREARFVRADLTDAVFTHADLLSADFQKARLGGADFSSASLYRADLARARMDDRTKLDGANVKHVRVVAASPQEPIDPTDSHGP